MTWGSQRDHPFGGVPGQGPGFLQGFALDPRKG